MKRLIILLVAVILLPYFSIAELDVYPPLPDAEYLVEALCEKVVDGDTAWFTIVEDGIEVTHKIRFLNMDTPETVHPSQEVQPGGKAASDYVKETLEGQKVWLEYDVQHLDKYGRQLCHIWLPGGVLYNLQLVELGYATVTIYRPNIKYAKFFIAAQELAMETERGLWEPAVSVP